MWMRISVRSPSNFSWVITHLEPTRQTNSCNRKKQSCHHTCAHISRRAEPCAFFQHFGGFPTKAGECSIAAKETDGDGHAPVRRNQHAIHRELPDQAQEETPRQINQQRAVGKGASQTNLHDALKAVTRKSADGAKDRNQCNTQCCSNPRPVRTQRRIPLRRTKQKTPGAARLPGVISTSKNRRSGCGELHRHSKVTSV